MNPSEIGGRAEAAVLSMLACSGKNVLLPFGGHHRFDLGFEENGRFFKVQCKTGHVRDGAIWFKTHSVIGGVARDYKKDVDLFGVYCHERGEVYLVPVDDVPTRGAHLRIEPTRNSQVSGVRWAEQYLLSPEAQVVATEPFVDDTRQLRLVI